MTSSFFCLFMYLLFFRENFISNVKLQEHQQNFCVLFTIPFWDEILFEMQRCINNNNINNNNNNVRVCVWNLLIILHFRIRAVAIAVFTPPFQTHQLLNCPLTIVTSGNYLDFVYNLCIDYYVLNCNYEKLYILK